jgi:hypothetical protein
MHPIPRHFDAIPAWVHQHEAKRQERENAVKRAARLASMDARDRQKLVRMPDIQFAKRRLSWEGY